MSTSSMMILPRLSAQDPLSGHPGHLDPGQQHKLGQFKAELTAEGLYDPDKFDDAYLLYV